MSNSTIAAVATPLGESSIGVIRISGDRAIETADKVFFAFSGEKLSSLSGYKAAYGEIKDGARVLDDAVIISQGGIFLADSCGNIRSRTGGTVNDLFREVFRC